MSAKPKIFMWWTPNSFGGVAAYAMSEDGKGLAAHLCSNDSYAYGDIHTVDKIAIYEKKYPDGYQLVWLGGNPAADPDWRAAFRLNQEAK